MKALRPAHQGPVMAHLMTHAKVFLSTWRCSLIAFQVKKSKISYVSFYRGATKKVKAGNDQEKAQSEKDSHSKNQGGKKLN